VTGVQTCALPICTSMPTARTIRLVRNYRSSQAIVTTANSLLRHTAKSALTLRTDNPVGQQPNMVEYPTDEAEATGVVNAISAEIRAGRRPRNIAVLFRTNGQSQDQKSTRLNSSHVSISYAVFCLKKKKE